MTVPILVLDDEANRSNASTISPPTSRVRVVVAPTNEEWMAARHAMASLRGREAVGRALDFVTEVAHGSQR